MGTSGMGHGSKKFAKMVFAPRLPQSWRGGDKIARGEPDLVDCTANHI